MSKPPSDATLLRTARSELKREQIAHAQTRQERNHYLDLATKAEQEVEFWKRRFDILLSREPK